ncbi:MAG TPA: type II toxin-antitoxin system RelE/ParE family toxin [Pyrinomonadaceae bacterium]|nr:type II toxin-antitoxin system RelE/ParE family toxin [Pyrinomonadaceae bacterium]
MIKYSQGLSAELAQIASYLAQYNESTAERFLDHCEESFQLLERFPERGSPRRFEEPELASIRMSLVKGFDDYLIFYIPFLGGVRILHVIHSALDYNRIVDIGDL